MSYMPKESVKPTSVGEYVDSVPRLTRPLFDELRLLVRQALPDAHEVFSYGIIGYKIDDKRARVFISGWGDHVAIYPVPKDEALQEALQPYIKGKGTLWFPLEKPLPSELILQTIKSLASNT